MQAFLGDRMFQWFNTKNAVQFGIELAKLYAELVPCELDQTSSKRVSKINYAKEKMTKKIRAFKKEEVLNFFKTAKLLNTFKWELKDHKYSDSEIDSIASWVFISLRNQNF